MAVPDTARAAWTSIDWSAHVHDRSVAGRTIRYLDYGEGPPIALVHGAGGCWQWWLEIIPGLAERHRVIAIDLPGFGRSECLPHPIEFDDYPRALAGLLDALQLDRVVLAGHSLGGLAAIRFAVVAPERLAGLTLVDAGGAPLPPVQLRTIVGAFRIFEALARQPGVARAAARRPRLRRLVFAAGIADRLALTREMAAEIVPAMAAPGFIDGIRAGAGAAAEPQAERVTAPTLLAWGQQDRILPVNRARELRAAIPGAQLVVFPGVGHCPMLECPALLKTELVNFAETVFATTAASKRGSTSPRPVAM